MAETTYTQYYSNFIGADMSSDPRTVARNRLAYCVNMWRDYESEQGAAIETFPGFRKVLGVPTGDEYHGHSAICGFWKYKGKTETYIIIHYENFLVACTVTALQQLNTAIQLDMDELENTEESSSYVIKRDMQYGAYGADTAFTINNNLFIVNSGKLVRVYDVYNDKSNKYEIKAEDITEYYVPTTYYNGKPYEQRNGFTSEVKQINTDGGTEEEYTYQYKENSESFPEEDTVTLATFTLNEKARSISSVTVGGVEFTLKGVSEKFGDNHYIVTYQQDGGLMRPIKISFLKSAIEPTEDTIEKVEIKYGVEPTHFNTIGNLTHFQNDKLTMAEAVLGCTKSAVYDGRVFLTGNPELPNTVFYSQRNLTGANDPTYFGVYNYFNDGDGNTPNVDLLAMPSMLMVIKGDTVQDGSVYYHVGTDNTHEDESVRNLMPRVYPSTKGAAGLGSAGKTDAYSLSCNFLDDPVFLSKRGLEAVGKENVSLERTLVHRSSNIDRLLLREDLAHASIAEWKGYLVICCNGHVYLADSRRLSQHPDGSYQYEWFYLEGVGTYKNYTNVYFKVTEWPRIGEKSLKDIIAQNTKEQYRLWDSEGTIWAVVGKGNIVSEVINSTTVYYYLNYVDTSRWIVDVAYGEKVGTGKFYGAKRVLAVGDLLFFATDFDICIFNTDKRGENIYDESGEIVREVDEDKIDSSYYTFNGVRYLSGCSTRLDDCDKKSLTKNTLYGTTAPRFKMIPGSHCKIRSSINSRDWEDIGEAFSSRTNTSDMDFGSFSFAEDEDDVVVLPEISRGWVNKQYYFYSDGFCEPFGLYELSYIYKIAGKIRYY